MKVTARQHQYIVHGYHRPLSVEYWSSKEGCLSLLLQVMLGRDCVWPLVVNNPLKGSMNLIC
ncbi:hypothetical protein M8C21_028755 [Ambrosia artemisiifolia]|uniref:Uncharacterized protein n=1 Tax=Ambrosia artemisiifolia TaxID=4212 RepID=A0AAD5CAE5_AMBAR|nr:hypothetical protein M8C21_028755 [Ambrosia artemisiifolia]